MSFLGISRSRRVHHHGISRQTLLSQQSPKTLHYKGEQIIVLMPRIYHIDVANDHSQQGQLLGSSWPFAVRMYVTMDGSLNCVDTQPVSIRTEAGEAAENWARQKRGNMALAYSRRTGMVQAQYCQAPDGFLGFLLYTPHGRLEEQHNAHLFEALPGMTPQERGESEREAQRSIPFVETAPTCTYPVGDDAHPGQEWWYAQRPSNSGLWMSVFADRPLDETAEDEPLLTAVLEVFGGQLRILWWNRDNLEGDPHILVVEDDLTGVPLARLATLRQKRVGNV